MKLATNPRLFQSTATVFLLYLKWVILKADMQKLEVTQIKCLRQILNTDRIVNETIHKTVASSPLLNPKSEVEGSCGLSI